MFGSGATRGIGTGSADLIRATRFWGHFLTPGGAFCADVPLVEDREVYAARCTQFRCVQLHDV